MLRIIEKAAEVADVGITRRAPAGHAIDDEAQPFYEHYHFVPVHNRKRRRVMKVSTVAKALGERWRSE